jgi:type II secretory pathway pseudopilin PulG
MKPHTPHDPFDDLIAAALHGELTPEERTQFEARLSNDPAAQKAYQEAQAMHDLLEKTHKNAQPDPNFEQRMVSGVRRKLQTEKHRESGLESLLALWAWLKRFPRCFRLVEVAVVLGIIAILAGVALGPITSGIKQAKQSAEMQEAHQQALADYQAQVDAGNPNPVMKDARVFLPKEEADDQKQRSQSFFALMPPKSVFSTITSQLAMAGSAGTPPVDVFMRTRVPSSTQVAGNNYRNGSDANGTSSQRLQAQQMQMAQAEKAQVKMPALASINAPTVPDAPAVAASAQSVPTETTSAPPTPLNRNGFADDEQKTKSDSNFNVQAIKEKAVTANDTGAPVAAPSADGSTPLTTAAIDTRKLIRNAQLDFEVKGYQPAMDEITAQTKAAGGYVDTSNAQKGGNGKLQGTVVVKVLPQNLDAFLLKLRDLGQVQNQSVSTDDVTKDYYDTQARLDNSRRMEEQLQDLLKRENGKVSDLLAVERELGRVRGDIEQMQGQLKLYDFQVQYATITIQMKEKDLNQAAAYLLKEQDDFSLFATDVETTFQKARQAADDFKAQVLTANLNHNSGSDVSAELEVMVAPDQIEPFLAQVRGLGRVANFTRETQRVAKDGGDSDQPADQTLTEKDKVQVHLAIRSDDETRKQVALTVVAKAVDAALDDAKAAAMANAGVEILSSSLNKTPEGASTAQLSVRVPGPEYSTLIAAFKELGRTGSLSIQRNDNSGPGANGDDAPVIVSLSLTDDDTPLQETALTVLADDVDNQSQQIKKDAGAVGVEVKASSFERQPDGTELAQMTFRLPMAKYPAFLESVKKLGKVESLTVQRQDRPDQTITDDTAPAEITLQLHNEREIIAEDNCLFATLRNTFVEGAAALFASVRVIGVLIAFTAPWVFTLGLFAWIGRRIYVWRNNK